MSLASLLAIAAVLILLSLLVQAFFLWIAARLCRIPATTYRRALGTCLVITLLTAAIGAGGFVAERSLHGVWTGGVEGGATRLLRALPMALLAAGLLLPWLLVKWFLRASWGKAFLATVLMIVLGNTFSVGLALAVRWTLLEAFVVPAGSMATAIYGPHSQVTCPNCGWEYALSMSDRLALWRLHDPRPVATACPNCGHESTVAPEAEILQGDRILVEKVSTPERWDLIVFKYPEDPSINFIKRLVGLPGETVEVANGEVFIDGHLQHKPPGIAVEMWLPVHDTRYTPKQRSPDGLQWKPADPASNWRHAAGAWSCESPEGEADVLELSGTLTNRLAYNGAAEESDVAWPGEEVLPLLASDVKVECAIADFSEGGSLGFEWEFRGRRVRATVFSGNPVEIVESRLATPESAPEAEKNSMAGFLLRALPPGTKLAFAVRDGQAYILQEDAVCGYLQLEKPPSKWSEPCRLRIVAEGCSVTLDGIRLYRDVYYRTLDQISGPRMPRTSDPGDDRITLGPNEYFMLGDNTTRSKDSRFWGAVRSDALIGVARWIYWPPDRWHEFR